GAGHRRARDIRSKCPWHAARTRRRWYPDVAAASGAGAARMSTPPILIATRNPGKLAEMRPLLAHAGMHIIDLGAAGLEERTEEADLECFETFEENARAKARYFH